MANATTMTTFPVVLEATSTQQQIAVDPSRWHQLQHCGEDASGSTDEANIYLTFEREGGALTVDNDASEGANKAKLINGKPDLFIQPGCGAIAFRTASGSPTFQIIPLARDIDA